MTMFRTTPETREATRRWRPYWWLPGTPALCLLNALGAAGCVCALLALREFDARMDAAIVPAIFGLGALTCAMLAGAVLTLPVRRPRA